ncbi:hypothetical protein, partial [Salmonella sp. SAL4431]|uniref:hypothetical protein n=1 Tax=Salmonella sp. SAL4431 TaxID=3159886 RepID=UPI00397AD050
MVGTLYGAAIVPSTPVSLGSAIGDKVELTFDFAFSNGNGTTGTSDWQYSGMSATTIRFGLFNSAGTALSANGG